VRGRAGAALGLALHGGLGFAMPAGAGASADAVRLRACARALIRRRWPGPLRPIGIVAMTLGWPLGAALEAWRLDERPGAGSGSPPPRVAAWVAALRHNLRPAEWLGWGLDRPGAPAPAAWLPEVEGMALSAVLAGDAARVLARDKLAFDRFARAEGLVVPALIGVLDGAGDVPGALPPVDLVAKPRFGRGGQGVVLWRWTGQEHRAAPDGPSLAGMVDRLPAGARPMLVQARVAGPAGAAPPVARLVTLCPRIGPPELAYALVQQPEPDAAVSQGGACAALDPVSGRVIPPPPPWPARAGAHFTLGPGPLPGWEAARAMALTGHVRFPGAPALIGWDVAFGAAGPVLLEANIALSLFLEQRLSGVPAAERLAPGLLGWLA